MSTVASLLLVLITLAGVDNVESQPADGDVRMQDELAPGFGRVEFYENGQWNTFCGESFNGLQAAKLICRELGYHIDGYNFHPVNGMFPGDESMNMIKDNFLCTGNEARLADCPRSTQHNSWYDTCTHALDSGVICETPDPGFSYDLRLVDHDGNPSTTEGRLELNILGPDIWSFFCNIPEIMDPETATIACRELGIPGRGEGIAQYGGGQNGAAIGYVHCNYLDTELDHCVANNGNYFHTPCFSEMAAGLRCGIEGICPRGSYNADTGSSPCTLCPEGTYAENEGSRSCESCGNDNTSPAGSISFDACTMIRISDGHTVTSGRAEVYYSNNEYMGGDGNPEAVYQWATFCRDRIQGDINGLAEMTCSYINGAVSAIGTSFVISGEGYLPLDNPDDVGIYELVLHCSVGDSTMTPPICQAVNTDETIPCTHEQDVNIICNFNGCPPGTYLRSGNTDCAVCQPQTYQNEAGQTACKPCPADQTSPVGATSRNMCYAQATGILDPHFMITDSRNNKHLCFDYSGDDGDVMVLIKDTNINLEVTGKLYSTDAEDENSPVYFSTIEIITDVLKLTFDQKKIDINGSILAWNLSDTYKGNDVIIHPKSNDNHGESLRVYMYDRGVTLVITRQAGSDVGTYLGIYVVDAQAVTQESTGVIGQFLHAGYRWYENNGVQHVEVTIPRDAGESSTIVDVAVSEQSRYSPTDHSLVQCWMYAPGQGHEDLLIGGHHYLAKKHQQL